MDLVLGDIIKDRDAIPKIRDSYYVVYFTCAKSWATASPLDV